MDFTKTTQNQFNNLSNNFTTYTNEMLSLIKRKNIKSVNIQDCYQIAMATYNQTTKTELTQIKFIAILTYLKFNNIDFTPQLFNKLCQEMEIA